MIVRCIDQEGQVRLLDWVEVGRKRYAPATENDRRKMVLAWTGARGHRQESGDVVNWLASLEIPDPGDFPPEAA